VNVARIAAATGKAFVIEHHYSHGIHNGPMTWGLFDGGELVGVIAFATPSSENVRASVFGPDYVRSVTELHRLVLLDRMPRNSESWFIARGLRALKEERDYYRAVLSFADATQGHIGTIYQATNAIYTGTSGRARFYLDATGRLRHPRQNGHNVTATEATSWGWQPTMREGKHRYLFLLGNRREVVASRRLLRLATLPYPKNPDGLRTTDR
jgi:hypothetical protein